jgi:hypothetical protein
MSLIVGGKTYKKTNKKQTTTKGVNEFCFVLFFFFLSQTQVSHSQSFPLQQLIFNIVRRPCKSPLSPSIQ